MKTEYNEMTGCYERVRNIPRISESLAPKIINSGNSNETIIKQAEFNLFKAAKNYAKIVNEKLLCKPLQRKNTERKYEKALEELGIASLDYSIAVGSPPYNKEE